MRVLFFFHKGVENYVLWLSYRYYWLLYALLLSEKPYGYCRLSVHCIIKPQKSQGHKTTPWTGTL